MCCCSRSALGSCCWAIAAKLIDNRIAMRVVNLLIFINRFFLFHAKAQRPRKGAKNAKVCQHFFFAPLRELCAFSRKNSYSTQSAMNTFVSPDFSALRLDE